MNNAFLPFAHEKKVLMSLPCFAFDLRNRRRTQNIFDTFQTLHGKTVGMDDLLVIFVPSALITQQRMCVSDVVQGSNEEKPHCAGAEETPAHTFAW